MKKALIATALASGILVTAPAALAGTGYIGMDYQLFNITPDASGADDFSPEGIAVKIGGSLSDYAMIEGRFGSSSADDNANDTALQVDNFMGVFIKGGMDVANMVFPYVIVGATKFEFQAYDEPDETESDLSYGVGADLHFGDLQFGAEWMMMQDTKDFDMEVISVSAAWRF